jgi:DNA-directed RNA polymerase subunit RPC12/RpoP
LIFVALGLTFSLIRIEEVRRLLVVTASLLLSGTYIIYSIFIFSSSDAKKIYQKRIFHDEDSSKGWICPKCSSKMLFSFACWNCGFKKADLSKPEQLSEKENDKIEKYLKKKTEEGEIGNA